MFNSTQLQELTAQMAEEISALSLKAPLLIGIHTGGVWVAREIQRHLPDIATLGTLDISFYRDDFSRVGLNPQVRASSLPEAIDEREIILVDDVLHTGRTIRAGLNEIFSYGRPARVVLAVLIERPGRELPIQADVIGRSLKLSDNQEARLQSGDSGSKLDIIDLPEKDNT